MTYNLFVFHRKVLSLEFEDDDDLFLLDETVSQFYFTDINFQILCVSCSMSY